MGDNTNEIVAKDKTEESDDEETESSPDFRAQDDELMAVESILGPEYVSLHTTKLRSGQIKIFVNLSDNFKVINGSSPPATPEDDLSALNISTESEHQDKPSEKENQSNNAFPIEHTYAVKHLPPLILYFTFPKRYPSEDKPIFTLLSTWLDRQSLSALCRRLDRLWQKYEGMEILYLWASFLKEESMSFLGFNEKYDISCHRTIASSKIHSGGLRRSSSGTYKDKMERRSSQGTPTTPKPIATTTSPVGTPGTSCQQPINQESESESISTDIPGSIVSDTLIPTASPEPVPGPSHTVRIKNGFKNTSSKGSASKSKLSSCVPLDHRAVCEYNAGANTHDDQLIKYLMDYNEEKEESDFAAAVHTCLVCYSDKSGSEFIRLKCRHAFCKECMKSCYVTHIQEGNVQAVKCMAHKCPEVPSFTKIKAVVGEDLFNRYDALLLKIALESMDDLIYCPRIVCGKPVISDPNDKLAECSACGYKFCSACKMVYHGVEPCRFKSEEHKKVFEDYTNGTEEEKVVLEKTYGKRQLKLLVEQTLSEKWLENQSKPCPHCKAPIDKFEGCNKITCGKCNSYFCWVCLQQLDRSNPYYHFNNPASPCYNNLFQGANHDDDDEDDNNAEDVDIEDDFEFETMLWTEQENEIRNLVEAVLDKFGEAEFPAPLRERVYRLCLVDTEEMLNERLAIFNEFTKSEDPIAELIQYIKTQQYWDSSDED